MQFSYYLKICRQKYHLTQEQLVQELHNFDELFANLDFVTLSRWERGITYPSVDKQLKIIETFQKYTSSIFPCYESTNFEELQAQICQTGIENIIGKNKQLVLNFPSAYIIADDLKITHLKDNKNIQSVVNIATSLDKEFTQQYSQIKDKNFKEWALHPSSLFLICEYKEQFFGLLFILRLKPEIFEKIINLQMHEEDIEVKHFANLDEDGCSYLLNFFAHSDKSASLLFVRYYAHLIAYQNSTLEVGVATMMDEGKKLMGRLNISHYKDKKHQISFYRAPLKDILINESLLKILFTK